MDQIGQEEEDEEESSSILGAKNANLDDELRKFRQNWRLELKNVEEKEKEKFSSSRKFYHLAVICEQNGRFRDAVEFYRRALKLDPEIESQFLVASKNPNSQAGLSRFLPALPTAGNLAIDLSTMLAYSKLVVDRYHREKGQTCLSKIVHRQTAGEDNSFQDRAFSQQWHLVIYYRYLRFFEDGHVIMITTSDEPSIVVPRLKNRHEIWKNNFLSPKLLSGNFVLEIDDDFKTSHVTCFFSRWKNESNGNDSKRKMQENINNGQCFITELTICAPKRGNFVLEWRNYQIKTKNYSTKSQKEESGEEEDVNILQINERHFTPFYFSRVKSYANYSENCL
uniref:F-box protein Hrt3/FBXO9 C-terminal domain-containing protein n=1 Tax=Romanomermis culicivorax TaxID=13658 RepID=A0A915JL62_ROMCU